MTQRTPEQIIADALKDNLPGWLQRQDTFAAIAVKALAEAGYVVVNASSDVADVLARYRYAVNWIGSDSWDFCSECRERIRWAASSDRDRHSAMPADAMASQGQQFARHSERDWIGHLLVDGAGI